MTERNSPIVSQGHRIIINEATELKPEDRERLERVEQKLDHLLTSVAALRDEMDTAEQCQVADPWYTKVNWSRIMIASALCAAIIRHSGDITVIEKILNLAVLLLP